jgi:hypothetical protein
MARDSRRSLLETRCLVANSSLPGAPLLTFDRSWEDTPIESL